MSIWQINLEGRNKVEEAIWRLRTYVVQDSYLAFSGGKDSVVTEDLVALAGVPHTTHYNVSPVDPPEIHRFIKKFYPGVSWDVLARNFWKRFLTEGPPMRKQRWCCSMIKEAGGLGTIKILGTRARESTSRHKYAVFEESTKNPGTGTYLLRPIVDWTDREVWEYIGYRALPFCSLYGEGYKRLGCVLCPFEPTAVTRKNLERFPKIVANWHAAFERYWQVRIERGTPLDFESVEAYWQWWLSRKAKNG